MSTISICAVLAYIFIAAIHSYYSDNSARFRQITKPWLMPLLALFYFFSPGDSLWIYGALLFAWLGDIALLRRGTLFFILGLVSFLVGHLCMSSYLFHQLSTELNSSITGIVFVVMMSLAFALFNYLRPHLGSLKLPVLAYCLVLSTKGSLAVLLLWQMPNMITVLIAAGALIFMASDLSLAIDRFIKPIHKVHLWVMGSYTLAQGMMITGVSYLY